MASPRRREHHQDWSPIIVLACFCASFRLAYNPKNSERQQVHSPCRLLPMLCIAPPHSASELCQGRPTFHDPRLSLALLGAFSQTGSNDQLVFFRAASTRRRSIAIVDRWPSFGSAISHQQKFTITACDLAFIGIAAFLLSCMLYYTNL